jgi:predicted transglutaminase-like cysteine proteinase
MIKNRTIVCIKEKWLLGVRKAIRYFMMGMVVSVIPSRCLGGPLLDLYEKTCAEESEKHTIVCIRMADMIAHTLDRENIQDLERIKQINHYVNGYIPAADQDQYETDDFWATPYEFLEYGYGDCEDYAILKYYLLKETGFSESTLYFWVVTDKYSGTGHMVLLVSFMNNLYVLDNLSRLMLSLESRTDLKLHYGFNERGRYTIDEKVKIIRVSDRKEMRFEKMEERFLQRTR